jgi:type IV pilus assembly protein PilF
MASGRAPLIVSIVLAAVGCTSTSNDVTKPQPDRASEINLEMGIDYLRKGNLTQAKEKIDRSVQQNPRNGKAQAAAGLLYDRLGEAKKADSHFDRAISLESKDPEIANNYAAFLCRSDRFEKGEKFALQAANNPLYKTPEVAFLNAGHCARADGDLPRAEQHYRQALALRPRFSQALFELAEIEHQQKDYLSSRAFLQRLMELGRPNPQSLWLCVRTERALSNTSAAGACAARLKNEYPSAAETKELLESERKPG